MLLPLSPSSCSQQSLLLCFPLFYFYALTVWMLPAPPCFCASWKLLPPLLGKIFQSLVQASSLFKHCVWYYVLPLAFIRDCAAILF